MSNLEQIREEIDKVDGQLTALLRRRLVLSRAVAETKQADGSPIYRPDREESILSEAEKCVPEAPLLSRSFFQNLMRIIRVQQYQLLADAGRRPACLAELSAPAPCRRLAHSGDKFSWSYSAASALVPDAELISAATFAAVFEAVNSGAADAGVVPLENSTAGNITDVYDLLIDYGLRVTRSTVLDIAYVLAAPQGSALSDIHTVYSHPQALAQCAGYLREHSMRPEPFSNTAGSAYYVAESGRAGVAALCPRAAAEAAGLAILDAGIRDNAENSTRFIYVEWGLSAPQRHGIVSVAFSLPHRSGTLASVTSLFADLGINLAKIAARPILTRAWEYFFYLDFEGGFSDIRTLTVLLFLESELPYFKLLGGYEKSTHKEDIPS